MRVKKAGKSSEQPSYKKTGRQFVGMIAKII
jgi:hypothetical protein